MLWLSLSSRISVTDPGTPWNLDECSNILNLDSVGTARCETKARKLQPFPAPPRLESFTLKYTTRRITVRTNSQLAKLAPTHPNPSLGPSNASNACAVNSNLMQVPTLARPRQELCEIVDYPRTGRDSACASNSGKTVAQVTFEVLLASFILWEMRYY